MGRAVRDSTREVGSAVLASLRVVTLVYTGLGGFAALGLVLAAALMPHSPIIDQVTEPARQAITSLGVQPTGELVPGLISAPPPSLVLVPLATPEPFVATISLDITIADEAEPIPEPVEATASSPVVAPRVTRHVAQPTPVAEPEPAEDETPPTEIIEMPTPVAQQAIVESTPPELHTASVEAPRPLPTPVPTLTPAQVKAQQEAQNATAIAANKAAQAQAKAAADAANHAAIQANAVPVTSGDNALAQRAPTVPAVQPTVAPKATTVAPKATATPTKTAKR